MSKTEPRKLAEIVDAAWASIGVQSTPSVRRWVRKHVSDRERVACVADWLRHELESRERRETLRAERTAERQLDAPSPAAEESDRERIERRRKRDEKSAFITERLAALCSSVEAAVESHEVALEMAWTPELLQSSLRLPDGTPTTWGDATLEQHRIRESMFMDNATANIEGAARHRRAIKELTAAGADTLNQMMASEAA